LIKIETPFDSSTIPSFETDPLSIHLNFDNLPDSPIANGFAKNGSDTRELWLNGMLVESWTHTIVVGTGNPIGLLLSLTYA
jgi:hypothetical protein